MDAITRRFFASLFVSLSLMTTLALGAEPTAPPDPAKDRQAFVAWQTQLRQRLTDMLGIPRQRVPLAAESRGEIEHDGFVIEKWVFTSEPGSRVPALLYRSKDAPAPMPAIVFTYGHGGSKSSWAYHYAAQVYAKLGVACLAIDPIGEEERNIRGGVGTRAHDAKGVSERCDEAGRLIMGKLVFDTMRAVDFLMTRKDIAHDRIGIAGNSLGGATGGWVAAVETRLRMAIVTGWAFDDITIPTKLCTRVPNERMRKLCSWAEYAALPAPHCALFIANGDADTVIDHGGTGVAWRGTREAVIQAAKTYAALGAPGGIEAWFEPGGGHRPYFTFKVALEWIYKHLGTSGWTLEKIRALPTLNAGEWCDRHAIPLEKLYGTTLHWRGATLPDLNVRPLPREKLACLQPGEIGQPQFTLEGWLEQVSKRDR